MSFDEFYVRWSPTSVKGAFDIDHVTPPAGVKGFELNKGEPLMPRWGDGGLATLQDGNPNKPAIADCVLNTNGLLFVSERLKTALASNGVTHVEYLPFTLTWNGTPIGLPYFMVNCIDRPDCLDDAACETKPDLLGKGIGDVKRIVMASDPQRALFQFARFRRVHIASMRLAEALAAQAFSGIWWFALYDYGAFPEDKKNSPLSQRIRALSLEHAKALPQPIASIAAPPARKRASAKQVKAWLTEAPESGSFRGLSYLEGEDETWLDAYHDSPNDWPGFDPKRYRAFASDGQGNHFLLDLDQGGAVVFLSHETGYGEKSFEVVAASMADFAELITR